MAFSLRCPACRGKFRWDPNEGMPDKCELCGGKVGHDRDDDDLVWRLLRATDRTASIDKVYRDMEAGSEVRAQAAAEMLGVPTHEMSAIKITDMKDNQRQGDIAAVVPPNPVSQMMEATAGRTGFGVPDAVQYSQQSMTGPEPSAGARMRSTLQRFHEQSGHVVSDRPALETLQPGYRRRG